MADRSDRPGVGWSLLPALVVLGCSPLAAALTTQAFPPEDHGCIAWVGLIPFCGAVAGRSCRFERYLGATIASLVFYGLGFGFIETFGRTLTPAMPDRFEKLWLGTTAMWIWTWPATLWLTRRLSYSGGIPITASFPIAWVVVEHARHWFCLGVLGTECPWLHLGYSQVDCGPIRQLAALGGMSLISGLVASVNATLYVTARSCWLRSWPDRPERIAMLLSFVGLAAGIAYGAVSLQVSSPLATIRVALVSRVELFPHVGSEIAILRGEIDSALIKQGEPSAEGPRRGPDLVLYGENVVAGLDVDREGGHRKLSPWREVLEGVAHELKTYLVVGTTRAYQASAEERRSVSAVLVSPEAGIVARSNKMALVPFAERSPPWTRHPWVGSVLPVTAPSDDFTPADELGIFALRASSIDRPVRLGVGLCYDVSSSCAFRTAASRVDAFLVLGNEPVDSRRCVPTWLLTMSRCRAVESGRAIARTAINGSTCLIDRQGRIVAEAPRDPSDRVEALMSNLGLARDATPFQRLGDWPVHLALLLGCASLSWSRIIPGER